jgi:hypothetical protein
MRVERGEITLDQMEEILLKRYADEDAARSEAEAEPQAR